MRVSTETRAVVEREEASNTQVDEDEIGESKEPTDLIGRARTVFFANRSKRWVPVF